MLRTTRPNRWWIPYRVRQIHRWIGVFHISFYTAFINWSHLIREGWFGTYLQDKKFLQHFEKSFFLLSLLCCLNFVFFSHSGGIIHAVQRKNERREFFLTESIMRFYSSVFCTLSALVDFISFAISRSSSKKKHIPWCWIQCAVFFPHCGKRHRAFSTLWDMNCSKFSCCGIHHGIIFTNRTILFIPL